MKNSTTTILDNFKELEKTLKEGGGKKGQERQKSLNRMPVRERLNVLLDTPDEFFELGLFAAFEMYQEFGGLPAAGVVTGIGKVSERDCMIIANDATVKAGAFFPQTVKKVLRAQTIAYECRLPVLYLVDSSGAFLPLQDEIFPDQDDFGRIFRNNSVLSALGIPQYAAIMGNCIAGGGYLPVLCDQLLMTEGSGLYLAGPALVKAAIGQVSSAEEIGGADLHAKVSGTVDFLEKDDLSCLMKLRSLVGFIKEDETIFPYLPKKPIDEELLERITLGKEYDASHFLKSIFDDGSLIEYKQEYGKTLLTAFGRISGIPVGIIANQRKHVTTGRGEVELGGVIYAESADKAARFVLECNQLGIPLIFFQDVMGFMVGKAAESSGIIRSGAKLVNAISNSIVPKITCIIGNSFGAGNYALCGKAYDPTFILAWPNAKCAVMGASQAKETLSSLQRSKDVEALKKVFDSYESQTDIKYAAARGWVDAIIPPQETRRALFEAVRLSKRGKKESLQFHNGVIQT